MTIMTTVKYRTYKTLMGRKIRVRMTPYEIWERRAYWAAVTLLPIGGMLLLFRIWLSLG